MYENPFRKIRINLNKLHRDVAKDLNEPIESIVNAESNLDTIPVEQLIDLIKKYTDTYSSAGLTKDVFTNIFKQAIAEKQEALNTLIKFLDHNIEVKDRAKTKLVDGNPALLSKQKPPVEPTFRQRKAQRKEYYEKYVKYWKLRDCIACGGTGRYDNTGSPVCSSCEGSGKERYLPNYQQAQTALNDVIDQTLLLEMELSMALKMKNIDTPMVLEVRVRNRHDVIYAFTNKAYSDNVYSRTKLKFGYDMKNQVSDWYFDDVWGEKYFLHQFKKK